MIRIRTTAICMIDGRVGLHEMTGRDTEDIEDIGNAGRFRGGEMSYEWRIT